MQILITHKVKNIKNFVSSSYKKERDEFFSDFAKNIKEFISTDNTVAITANIFDQEILEKKRSSNENLELMRKQGVIIHSLKFFKKN